jgi:inhibitor of KinA sporulation pathway (predicted exonuclease)
LNHPIILFDFEYTAWEGSQARKWSEPWEHREIIQIAAIRVAIDDGMAELGSFDCLVRPKLNPTLSAYITTLTGIAQPAVDTEGVGFAKAFAAFYAFCDQGLLPLFCYGDDPSVLAENFSIHSIAPVLFPAGIYDIRVTFEQAGIDTRRYTSGTVHQAVSAEFFHTAHNALHDVRSLAATIRQLIRAGRLSAGWAGGAAPGKFSLA